MGRLSNAPSATTAEDRFPGFAGSLRRAKRNSKSWCHLTAALMILRCVDTQLARRKPGALRPRELDAMRQLVGRIRSQGLRRSLSRVIDAMVALSDSHVIRNELLVYADRLRKSGQIWLAIDIHRCIIRRSKHVAAFDLGGACRRLGFCLRETAAFDEAAHVYDEGLAWARAHHDRRALILLTIARGNLFRVSGHLSEAQRVLDLALDEATASADQELIARAAHERGIVAEEADRYVLALSYYDVAFRSLQPWLATVDTDALCARGRLMADIARALRNVSRHKIARKAFLYAYFYAKDRMITWPAAINLMDLAVLDEYATTFQQYRVKMSKTRMPWRLKLAYYRVVVAGCTKFNDPAGAAAARLEIARITAKHRLLESAEPRTPERPTAPAILPAPILRLVADVEKLSDVSALTAAAWKRWEKSLRRKNARPSRARHP